MIISYEMYRKHEAVVNACTSVGLLVCDEGHRLKNADGNKTIASLAASPCRRRVLLTVWRALCG